MGLTDAMRMARRSLPGLVRWNSWFSKILNWWHRREQKNTNVRTLKENASTIYLVVIGTWRTFQTQRKVELRRVFFTSLNLSTCHLQDLNDSLFYIFLHSWHGTVQSERSAWLNGAVQPQQCRHGERPIKTEMHFSLSLITGEPFATGLPQGPIISHHTARVTKALNINISSVIEVRSLKVTFTFSHIKAGFICSMHSYWSHWPLKYNFKGGDLGWNVLFL